jgi:hypothetical protein
LEIGRPEDQVLRFGSIPVQYLAMATEAVLPIDRLSLLGIATGSLPGGPGTGQDDQAHRTDDAEDFHVGYISAVDIHAFKGDSDPDEAVIYFWSRFSSLDMCPVQEQEKKN